MKRFSFVLMTGLLILGIGTNICLATPNPSESLLMAQNQGDQNTRLIPRRNTDRMMKQLNLSEEQKVKIEEIRQKYQNQFKPIKEQVQRNRKQIGNLMASDASANQIRAQHQQIENLTQQLNNIRFEEMLEIRDVLTVDQRKQFSQLMDQHRSKMRAKMGNSGNASQPVEPPPF